MPVYPAPDATAALVAAFLVLPALVVAAAVALVRRAWLANGHDAATSNRTAARAAAAFVVWSAAFLGLADAGLLARFDQLPPPPMVAFVFIFGTAIAVAASRFGRELAAGLSSTAIIGLQLFRLPLELTMHQAAAEGVMPIQMSFEGWNFDIVTGVCAGAVLLAYRSKAPPTFVVRGFALLGSALLVNILVIAIASTPMFHAFGTDPSQVNTFVFHAPFVLLPCVLVWVALIGQLVLFRKLASGEANTSAVVATV